MDKQEPFVNEDSELPVLGEADQIRGSYTTQERQGKCAPL